MRKRNDFDKKVNDEDVWPSRWQIRRKRENFYFFILCRQPEASQKCHQRKRPFCVFFCHRLSLTEQKIPFQDNFMRIPKGILDNHYRLERNAIQLHVVCCFSCCIFVVVGVFCVCCCCWWCCLCCCWVIQTLPSSYMWCAASLVGAKK